MGRCTEEILRQRELTFIGTMLASVTRGIREHLASTQESAARLVDLLGQANQGTGDEREKLADLLFAVERHVKILTYKSEHLDRFARRMGRRFSTFDPREVVEEAVLFSTRLAHLREVSLRLEVANPLPSLYGDPLRVHFVVLILMHSMLEQVSRGGKVIVRVGPAEKGVLVEAEGYGTQDAASKEPSEEVTRYWTIGQQVVTDLGGELQPASMAHDVKRTALFLPIQHVPNTSGEASLGQRCGA
jgi:C4-dicarboxylate-specific signal transduction histidine kinase